MMKRQTAIGVVLLLLMLTQQMFAQKVTLSNNLLYDATLTPNLRLGVRLSPHWSMGVTGGYRPWPTSDEKSTKWKHLLVSPDLRYWTDSVNVHHFFGINPVYVHYNISGIRLPFNLYQLDKNQRYQGDFFGLGAFYGYSWPLGRHWNFEAAIGAVVGYTLTEERAASMATFPPPMTTTSPLMSYFSLAPTSLRNSTAVVTPSASSPGTPTPFPP